MTQDVQEYQTCEACGVSAEMGFIIKENDDVADVTIFANGKAALEAELANYLALAKEHILSIIPFNSCYTFLEINHYITRIIW